MDFERVVAEIRADPDGIGASLAGAIVDAANQQGMRALQNLASEVPGAW